MAIKIAITNAKGGVAKTTTAINLADALMFLGNKVLFIDLDPQANSTSLYTKKLKLNEEQKTLFDFFLGKAKLEDCVFEADFGDIICGDNRLAEDDLYDFNYSDYTLIQKNISKLDKKYDYIIMDTPPSIQGTFMKNAVNASDGVIIPVQGKKFAIDGLSQLLEFLNRIKEKDNKKLKIYGVLITMFDVRQSQDKAILNVLPVVGKNLGFNVFDTTIRINQDIETCISDQKSLFRTKPSCNGAIDYANFTKEILTIINK